jgi:molybdate transport system substrate-binding protein
MKKHFQTLAMTGLLLLALGARAAEITVFAAVSLTDSLKEIAAHYEKRTGENVVFNFGASSTMARQIEEGAPADVFFSADEAKMDALQKRGFILPGTRKDRLSNSLVIVVPTDSSLNIASATNLADAIVRRVALADPQAVPAGIYSKEYLVKLHLWKAIEPKVVPTENVRAALAAVESGNVEAGMVYKTDAAISHKVKVACEIPLHDGPKITYPMAVISESKHVAEAKAFVKYLEGDDAAQLFEKYGFIVRK